MKKHTINTNKAPSIPYDGWKIESHKKMGKITITKDSLRLYTDPEQEKGYVVGNELLKRLTDKPILNATVMDYLWEHQELIPEEWKGKYVYFFGTVYRGSFQSLCVRYFYWSDGAWHRSYRWLGYHWDFRNPVASLASTEISNTKSSHSDSLSLDLALKTVKEAGYKVYKEV